MRATTYCRWFFLPLLLATLGAQDMPENDPRLTVFPQVGVGVQPVRLIPGTNVTFSGASWSATDTTLLIGTELDLQLVRFRWLDLVLSDSRFGGGGFMGYRQWMSMTRKELPSSFPGALIQDGGRFTGLVLQPFVREWYLGQDIRFHYRPRSDIHAGLQIGLAGLTLYQSEESGSHLGGSGIGLRIGLGWGTTLVGDAGDRLRIGVDLSYQLRNLTVDPPPDGTTTLNGGSNVSPIQEISLSGPGLRVNLEWGEFLRSRYIPYRDPFRLRLAQVGVGGGIINYQTGRTVRYATENDGFNASAAARVLEMVSFDLFRYNWLYHLVPQADLDVLSGLSYRRYKAAKRTPLPESWPKDFVCSDSSSCNAMMLAPAIGEISLDHDLIYPLSRRSYMQLSAGTGYAWMTLYENTAERRALRHETLSSHVGGGFGFLFRGDGSSRLDVSLHLAYRALDFDISDDPDFSRSDGGSEPQTPITGLDLSHLSFELKLGLIFGGHPNLGFKAHNLFRAGRFEEALELQEDFVAMMPRHHNNRQLRYQMEDVRDSVATDYYRSVESVLAKGRLQEAYSMISMGKDPRLPEVASQIKRLKSEIALQSLRKAAWFIRRYDYDQAEGMILLALRADREVEDVAIVLLGRSFLIRAAILYEAGIYERALYWLDQSAALTDRYDQANENLRRKIGEGRLDDANDGIMKEDRILVYDAMRDARELNPVLSSIVDDYLEGLEEAIDYYRDQTIAPMKRMAMDAILDDVAGLDPEDFEPQVGMKAVLIFRYVGEPTRRFMEAEYELWVYEYEDEPDIWLYIREGLVEKIERRTHLPR